MKKKKIEKLIHQTVSEELEKRFGRGQRMNAQQPDTEMAGSAHEYDMLPPDGEQVTDLRTELQQDMSSDAASSNS